MLVCGSSKSFGEEDLVAEVVGVNHEVGDVLVTLCGVGFAVGALAELDVETQTSLL